MTTLTLNLPEEQADRLKAQAAERGQSLEDYLIGLAEREPLPYAEWRKLLRSLPDLVPRKPPVLPDEAYDRTTMYRD